MNVTHGPLPQEGVLADAAQFLEAYVTGCEFSGIKDDHLALADVGYCSMTECDDDVDRTFWFQRGAGKLWIRQTACLNDTPVSYVAWVAITPIREVMDWAPSELKRSYGASLRPVGDYTNPGFGFPPATTYDPDTFAKPLTCSETQQSLGVYVNTAAPFGYISAETTTSQFGNRMVEFGLAEILLVTQASASTCDLQKGKHWITIRCDAPGRVYGTHHVTTDLGTMATGHSYIGVLADDATAVTQQRNFAYTHFRAPRLWPMHWTH